MSVHLQMGFWPSHHRRWQQESSEACLAHYRLRQTYIASGQNIYLHL